MARGTDVGIFRVEDQLGNCQSWEWRLWLVRGPRQVKSERCSRLRIWWLTNGDGERESTMFPALHLGWWKRPRQWVWLWTLLSLTSSGKLSKGFHYAWCRLRGYAPHCSPFLKGNTFSKAVYHSCFTKPTVRVFCYKIIIYDMIVVLCSIRQISLEFENAALPWQIPCLSQPGRHSPPFGVP